MKRLSFLVLLIAVIAISMMVYLASCGGGGGGNDVQEAPPPPGGSGTIGGVTVFWFPYDANIAMGTGNAVQETSDHGFVVAGSQSSIQGSSLGPQEVFLMKTDAKGTAAWMKRFAWPGGADAKAVRQTSDGGFIVTGQTITTNKFIGDSRVYLLKTDANGNAAAGWPKIFGGAVDSAGSSLLEVSDGYLIAGYTVGYMDQNNQPHQTIYLIHTDTTGSVVWEKKYNTNIFCQGGPQFGRALAATPDGNYVIAGMTGCYGWKGFLLKIDALGNVLPGWPQTYGGTSPAIAEQIYSVASTTDGFILAGSRGVVSGMTATYDALVIKTSVTGTELWRRTYGGADQDEAFSVAVTKDNEYLVFGYTQSYGGPVNKAYQWQYQDLLLIKLDSSGNTLWQKVKGNRPMSSDFGVAGCVVSDGGFAMTGSSGGNALLAKFDKDGDTINLGATDLSYTVPGKTGIITIGNAIDVASAGVTAIMNPRDIGATAVDLLIDTLRGQPDTSFCTSGSYAFSPAPTVSAPSTTLSFADCETGPIGDSTTLSGSAAINVTSFSYNFVTQPTYTIQTTLTDIDITAAETAGTLSSSITGGMRFYRMATASQMSEKSQSIDAPATTLTFTESDGVTTRAREVGPFIIRDVVTIASGAYYIGTVAGDTATVDMGLGPLLVTFPSTTTPVHGLSLGAAPVSGSFLVTAPSDSSRISVTFTNGVAEIAVDTDGDGTVDGTVSAPWDFLY